MSVAFWIAIIAAVLAGLGYMFTYLIGRKNDGMFNGFYIMPMTIGCYYMARGLKAVAGVAALVGTWQWLF
jgi:hypothetical protein